MSDIALSSSVRASLLSLQNTASMMETTQNRLATGKKVNSALDNPISFFTASGLDSRAGDISNLLDGISNGVQVIQAANTGITSLTSLVTTAKSIAQQALQVPLGYSSKSSTSVTIGGATSTDLRGTTTYTSATASSQGLVDGSASPAIATGTTKLDGTAGSLTSSVVKNNDTTAANITTSTLLYDASSGTSDALTTQAASAFQDGKTLTVNGHTITFKQAAAPASTSLTGTQGVSGNLVTDGTGNVTVYMGAGATTSTATVGDVLKAIDIASGVASTSVDASHVLTVTGSNAAIAAGATTLKSTTTTPLTITGTQNMLSELGFSAAGTNTVTLTAAPSQGTGSLSSAIQDGSTLSVNGKTITFSAGAAPSSVATGSTEVGNLVTDGSGNSTVYLKGGKLSDVLNAIDLATGVQTVQTAGLSGVLQTTAGDTASSVSATGALQISTGTTSDLTITGTGNALGSLGLTGNTGTATTFTAGRGAGAGSISGKTLSFSSFNGGTAVNVTFGDGTGGTVKTLDQLNSALNANNLTASIDSTGKLTVTTTNDYASSTIGSATAGGTIGGSLTTALTWSTASAPVADANSMATRASLVSQYNNIMSQITTTAQDSSYNGVNLLNGDQLKLTFNETGTSTLNITGVNFDAGGLGLSNLTSGTDFIDNNATNKVLTSLDNAATNLRTQASTFGSNLSVVQTRQDFNKNLVNVLQTGSSNLTLADTNQESANLLALQTRQSLSTTALSMAAQADQNVLRLFG